MNALPDKLVALRISGSDARSFLQGQLTQDMDDVQPSQPLLAGWNNPKGRLLCISAVLEIEQAFWLTVPESLLPDVQQRLRMYILRADVTIDVPATVVCLNSNPPDKDNISYCINYDSYVYFRVHGGPHMSLEHRRPEPADALRSDTLRSAQITAGIPSIWPATQGSFVPQMLNLDLLGAISFSKGCYVGQEIVARTQNLGRIKRRMYRFTGPAISASAGDKLWLEGRESGQIVDALATEAGLSLLAVTAIEQCNETFSLTAAGDQPLKRVALPYAVPEMLQ